MTVGRRNAAASLGRFGIEETYEDATGNQHRAPLETCRAIVDAMGQPEPQAQRDLGLNPNEAGLNEIRKKLADAAGLSNSMPINEVIARTYELLALSPSLIVSGTLDDALAVKERPSMPATTQENWPNWSLSLPESQENLERSRLALRIGNALNNRSAGVKAATLTISGKLE